MKKFLRCLFILILSSGLFGENSKSPFSGWAILQGPTTENTTVFSVLHLTKEEITPCILDKNEKCALTPSKTENKSHASSDWTVSHYFFNGIKAESNKVLFKNNAEEKDTREFKLLSNLKELHFAVASCMDDSLTDVQDKMWASLLDKNPDVLFLIGDNTYADKYVPSKSAVPPDTLWKRHTETRNTLDLFKSKKLVPVYSVWDDHDYGQNDSDSSYPFKKESKEIFLSFFPQRDTSNFKMGPGMSSYLQLAAEDFIFLDDRYYRTEKTHWGEDQEDWLFNLLKSSKNPAWLLNGDQFFGGYHTFESYEGNHPESFKKFLSRLKDIHKPVNFISGDRHLSEIMKIDKKEFGQEAYELTSSGIHAKTYPGAWDKKKNPRQVKGVSGEYNYMIVNSKSGPRGLKVKAEAYGLKGKFYDYEFELKK